MSKAQDKRFEAIKAIMERCLNRTTGEIAIANTEENRLDLSDLILSIQVLGRTQRWQDGVATWAQMVRNEEDLRWAIVQGHMYPVWAA